MTDEELDALEPFMNLSDDEIADMILMLMYEEMATKRLARFRPKDLEPKPVKSLKELRVARDDVVRVSDSLG